MDKCKIDRAKSRVKTNAYENHNENVENLLCIGVDGRTLLYMSNNSIKQPFVSTLLVKDFYF